MTSKNKKHNSHAQSMCLNEWCICLNKVEKSKSRIPLQFSDAALKLAVVAVQNTANAILSETK